MLREAVDVSTPAQGPRILMPTCRNFARRAFRCALYEAQDVLVDIANVDLICLEQGWGARVDPLWLRRPLYHDISRKLMFVNPGLQTVRLAHEYDLFVAVCQDYGDLQYINAIDGWRNHCKTSVCWIDEMWAAEIPKYKYWLHALSQFDYVFLGYRGSVDPLSDAINRRCHWLPGAADMFRFSPYPNRPARVIDVYSIGRRWEPVHQALLRAAGAGDLFYLYDTFAGNKPEVCDHQQHRNLFANVAKRSRYFTVAPAKMDQVTQGQPEVGYRYFEGAAAGTVMIGQPANCEAFRELFDWPDAVMPIQPDGSDVITVLNDLDSDPARVSTISRRNAVEALLRHDWIYRWKEMFRVVGSEPPPRMAVRERRLKDLADLASHATETEGRARDVEAASIRP
jgi:hypothetical protein